MAEFFLSSKRSNNIAGGTRQIMHKEVYTFNEKKIYPVVAQEKLLASSRHRKILEEIKATAGLPAGYYEAIYGELIDKFVSFVQVLPVNNEARLGSLMDEGLLRGLYAIQEQQKVDADPLITYVVFSSALLCDVGCVIENRTVIISAEDGSFMGVWDPYHDGEMSGGDYYRIRTGGGVTPWSGKRSTVSLASILMPTLGFEWIYSDSDTFNQWLALLTGDKEGSKTLQLCFDRGREMLEEFKTTDDFLELLEKVNELEPKNTKIGDEFIDWLKDSLGKDFIIVDEYDGLIFQTEDGELLLSPELFKRFAAAMGNKVDWQAALKALIRLGMIGTDQAVTYRLRVSPQVMKARVQMGATLFGVGGGKNLVKPGKTLATPSGDFTKQPKQILQPSPSAIPLADELLATLETHPAGVSQQPPWPTAAPQPQTAPSVAPKPVPVAAAKAPLPTATMADSDNRLGAPQDSIDKKMASSIPIVGYEANELLKRQLKNYLPPPSPEFMAQMFPEKPEDKYKGLKLLFRVVRFLMGFGGIGGLVAKKKLKKNLPQILLKKGMQMFGG